MISISLSKQKRQAYRRYWKFIFILEYYIIQNETPVRVLYGTQKNVRSDRAETSESPVRYFFMKKL